MTISEAKILKQAGILLLTGTHKNPWTFRTFSRGDGLCNCGAKQYLVLADLLGDLGRLGSHRLGGAQASLGGTQPFSQRLQGFVELKSQNLQLLQLPLPEGRERGGGGKDTKRWGGGGGGGGGGGELLLVFYCSHWFFYCYASLLNLELILCHTAVVFFINRDH